MTPLALSALDLGAIGGFITAAVGALAVLYKIKPDRDTLMITQAQGAATVLNNLVDTLREEVERERSKRKEAHARANELQARIYELEREAEGLRKRYGTRAQDDG